MTFLKVFLLFIESTCRFFGFFLLPTMQSLPKLLRFCLKDPAQNPCGLRVLWEGKKEDRSAAGQLTLHFLGFLHLQRAATKVGWTGFMRKRIRFWLPEVKSASRICHA